MHGCPLLGRVAVAYRETQSHYGPPPMTPRYTEDRLPTAYHEAGHAVVDYDHGTFGGRVTIVPDYDRGAEGSSGSEDWAGGLGESHTEEDAQAANDNYIVSLYAGLEAQRLVDPEGDPRGAGDDYEKARGEAEVRGLSDDDLEALRQRATDHVARRRDAVDRLARTLLVFGTLDEFQAEAVIEEAPFHERATVSSPLYTAHMSEEAVARYREEAREPIDWSKLDDGSGRDDRASTPDSDKWV